MASGLSCSCSIPLLRMTTLGQHFSTGSNCAVASHRRLSLDCPQQQPGHCGAPSPLPTRRCSHLAPNSRRGVSIDLSSGRGAAAESRSVVTSGKRTGGREPLCALRTMRSVESGAALASGLAAVSAVGVQTLEAKERENHQKHQQEESYMGSVAGPNGGARLNDVQVRALLAGVESAASGPHLTEGTNQELASSSVWTAAGAEASLTSALLRRTASATASASVGAAQPLLRARLVRGPGGGLVMVAMLTLAGLLTVMRSSSSHHSGDHAEMCDKCEGYGMCECSLCGGSGNILWEGKLLRNDPCPACLGDGCQKCESCGGHRKRRGVPPSMRNA